MNIKLWLMIAISTLLVDNKSDEFTISFNNPTESFSITSSFIKSTYWNVYIADEAYRHKQIPINYTISKDGTFKSILLGEVKMNELLEFENVKWDKVDKLKLRKEGESPIRVTRNKEDRTIVFSQRKGSIIPDNETITVKMK